MKQRPSDKCGDCFWWEDDPFLCEGCPNNPKPEDGGGKAAWTKCRPGLGKVFEKCLARVSGRRA